MQGKQDNKQIRRSIGWMGLKRGHKAHPIEWIVERLLFVMSLTSIAMVFLILAFVVREAMPVILGTTTSVVSQNVRAVEDLDKMSPKEIQEYLHISPGLYKELDRDALTALMEEKVNVAKEAAKDKDSGNNTISWAFLLMPYQWFGYDKPEYIWQPVSGTPKYNLIPLFIGSLKATLVALIFSVPLSLAAAIYVSQLCRPRLREWLKPAIELLAGIPSVVVGYVALMVLASIFQSLFGYQSRLNAFVAGIALGLAVIPVIFSIAEDALTSVPQSYVQAALALGASRWKAAWQVVLPAALPGVFAAVVLGFGRAIGETMIVLMASGNATIVSANPLDSTRTMTATIAAEMAETVFGGNHYRILFLIGSLLFIVTFASNWIGDMIVHKVKKRLEGKA